MNLKLSVGTLRVPPSHGNHLLLNISNLYESRARTHAKRTRARTRINNNGTSHDVPSNITQPNKG